MTVLRPIYGSAGLHAATAGAVPTATRRLANVEVWSYDAEKDRDSLAQKTGGPLTQDSIARQAYDNAIKVLEYYKSTYGRDSFDGRGTTVKVLVHCRDQSTGQVPANNAYWFNDEKRMWFGDGDGLVFSPLGGALDVVAHEFTHGVIDSELSLDTNGQEGGLHESFSDVIATGVDGNWEIGESVYTPNISGDFLRSLSQPKYSHVNEIPPGEDEPHNLASIANSAAYKVADKVGGDAMRQIWYKAMTDHLKDHSGFAGAAQATLAAAELMHGKGSSQYAAVRDAWTAVGVNEGTSKDNRTEAQRFKASSVARLVDLG